jgi:hypothetical protein
MMHFLLCFGLLHKNIKMGFGIKKVSKPEEEMGKVGG